MAVFQCAFAVALARKNIGKLVGLGLALTVSAGGAAQAQQSAPPPGAPDATTTIDGHFLPPFPQKFGGQIQLNAAQSKPFWPARVVPPKGAPNILVIMLDDAGFGSSSANSALRDSAR